MRQLQRFTWPVALAISVCAAVSAQDVRPEAVIQFYVQPSGNRLHLLARVPLDGIPQIAFPQRKAGMVDLAQVDDALLPRAATLGISDKLAVYEEDRDLAEPRVARARVSPIDDKWFDSYPAARSHIAAPRLAEDTEIAVDRAALDVEFEYPIESAQSHFSVRAAGIAPVGVRARTVILFVPATGATRKFEFLDDPGLVRMDPTWTQAVSHFFALGFSHLVDGINYVVLVFCMVIPFRRRTTLIPVVASFTVAHALALIVSAYPFGSYAPWIPPLIETAIAAALVLLALDNMIVPASVNRRCIAAFGFGLICGAAFGLGFRQVQQFAGSHSVASLLSFHAGIEAAQMLVLVLLVPTLEILFTVVVAERIGTIILSALAAHTGWHWMIERAGVLNSMGFRWSLAASLPKQGRMEWLLLAVFCAGFIWLAARLFHQRNLSERGGV